MFSSSMLWSLLITGQRALKGHRIDIDLEAHDDCENGPYYEKYKHLSRCSSPGRVWLESSLPINPPHAAKGRYIGSYVLTTSVAPWVSEALLKYSPPHEVLDLVRSPALGFHAVVEKERQSTRGLHDLDAIELTYQCILEIGAALLLAADKTDDPISLSLQYHTITKWLWPDRVRSYKKGLVFLWPALSH
ncbi:hypothetical protein GGR55DRAFT_141726 [Xylaria sp. FL0064]|nr:hypothetical protein GGR55DRAFT_141726 [Xylaria sp. FL0064]